MLYECLITDFQRKSSMENYKRESALKVATEKKRYKDTLKAFLKDFDIPIGLGNRLHRSDQSGEVTKEQRSMKKKENL